MGYVVVALVLLSLPFVLRRPWVGAVVYTVLAYLRPQDLAGNGVDDHFRLSLLVLAATAVGFAWAWAEHRERPLLGLSWFAFLAAMAVAMFAATRTAIDPPIATHAWLRFMQMLAGVTMTVVLCGTPERIRGVLIAIGLSIGAVAIWSLAFPHWDDGRLAGLGGKLGDSNDLALTLDMALPLLLFLRRNEPRTWMKWLLTIPIPFVLVATVLTYSRGGFLALAAVGIGWIVFSKTRIVRLLLAPVVAMAFFAAAPSSYWDRMTTIENYGHDESALDRISSWRVASRIVEKHPWTGVGPGNFLEVYDRYTLDFQKPHVAHNAWLQIAAESGLIPAIVFALLVLSAIVATQRLGFRVRRLRRTLAHGSEEDRAKAASIAWMDDYAQGIAVALVAFVIGAQFLSKDSFDLVYLLTGMAGALAVVAKRELAIERRPIVVRRVVHAPRPAASHAFAH